MPPLHNLRQETFVQKYAHGLVKAEAPLSATNAYVQVYHCQPDSARASAARLLANVSVQARVYELIAAHNRPETLAVDLTKLRHATKTVFIEGKPHEVSDNSTRLAAVTLCLRAAQEGLKPAEPVAVDAQSVTFNFSHLDVPRLQTIVTQMEAMRHTALTHPSAKQGKTPQPIPIASAMPLNTEDQQPKSEGDCENGPIA